MKKSIVFLAMMMTSTIIFAQSDSHGKTTKRSDQFKKELSLSDDQVAKVKAIRVKYAAEYSKVRRDSSLTQGTARNQQKSLRSAQDAEIKGVLTPEQWTKYTAMKTRHMDKHKRFHGAGKG